MYMSCYIGSITQSAIGRLDLDQARYIKLENLRKLLRMKYCGAGAILHGGMGTCLRRRDLGGSTSLVGPNLPDEHGAFHSPYLVRCGHVVPECRTSSVAGRGPTVVSALR